MLRERINCKIGRSALKATVKLLVGIAYDWWLSIHCIATLFTDHSNTMRCLHYDLAPLKKFRVVARNDTSALQRWLLACQIGIIRNPSCRLASDSRFHDDQYYLP